jgi:hypothetical protein
MCKYRSIIENPEKLRSMTGLTVEEFHALVPIFHAAFEAYMKRRTIDGHVRYCRRYVSIIIATLFPLQTCRFR